MESKTIDFEEGWEYIQTGITKRNRYLEGLGPEPDVPTYMELYTTVYIMSTQKPPHDYSQQLYDKYREAVEEYANSTALPALTDYFVCRKSLPPVKEVGLTSFSDLVCNNLQRKVKEAVITLVDKERDGEDIDRELVKSVIDVYVQIGMGKMERYEQYFERFLLEGASSYFSRKASRWIEEDSYNDYILKSEECLEKEKERVTHYLPSSSVPKLVKKVEHELLVKYANQLLQQSEFREMARGLEHIANIFKKHVTDADGHEDTEEHVLIKKLMELHDKYLVYVTKYSHNHTLFYKTLKEEFESFCRQTVDGSSSNAELLATFCDRIILKKWGSGEEELSDEAIEKGVILLAYISDDKYLFAEFYRKKLALRLLLNRNANDHHDHERSILTKLKQKFGKQITFKMEKMVTDLILSRENHNGFSEYVANNPNAKPGIDFTVTLLTNGCWPSYKKFGINLPSDMVKCVEVYKGFYEAKTKARKLTWIHSLGTCHINGKFDQNTIELILSTHQAALLLLFNTRDIMSYTDIQTPLNVTDEDLVRLLLSLSCAKVKIPLPRVDERKKVVEDVEKDRRYAIDAAIVRIMKGSKVLGHQQLVSECVEQLSRMFKPDIKAIKKRIEDLINRDYLERDKEHPNMFRYLA
ncbi:unnamed protein product [Microthlaspi erraticum]|uniref:Cullin family profile domain-containing protein n=1 Tax=Microthlaspi erraticum TaxID=1685480 RepID=A0A6D2KIR1_9BRAS|nr:unnamed protein product [Microthlaspi erraticum]